MFIIEKVFIKLFSPNLAHVDLALTNLTLKDYLNVDVHLPVYIFFPKKKAAKFLPAKIIIKQLVNGRLSRI